MASTIITKNSSVANAVPLASNMTQGELAINTTDRRLYTKNSAGNVVEVGWVTGYGGGVPETYTATAGQTAFTTVESYVPNGNNIAVYIDGLRTFEFTESGPNLVTLTPRTAGQQVTIIIGYGVAGAVSLTNVGTGMAEDEYGKSSDTSYHFRRRASYSGGTPGFVNAALWADTFVESSPGMPSSATAFEWTGVFVMHNRATAGENVACYRQGIKYSGAGPTWAGVDEIIDWNSNPTSGVVGTEISFTANGTDTNMARVGCDISLRKRDASGTAPTLTWGYRIQGEAGSVVDRGFTFAGGSTTVGKAFDTTLATVTQSALAIAENQPITFNVALSRKLFHNGSGFQFTNQTNTPFWSFQDSGSLLNNGVQVLGLRHSGWQAPTGTATRTTFATSTVTTAQLAERVKALIDDLTDHGLIGA